MMGSRGGSLGDAYEAFTRKARHIIKWKRGELHAIKQRHSKWQRRAAKSVVRAEAQENTRDV
ncbi:hypothetical protein [Methylorubrum suomiense]|uniref:Transposase n=1 Tax=Methylorubrum suomiense TaxID=144191 RepID=A0ABQ4V8N4_9HYPH|nr:hypothetical protein [Methylorubrum suomiense]GJE78652.1 hypothetical protein BGCPKDLD_5274 [Methylorubrum suomiense]